MKHLHFHLSTRIVFIALCILIVFYAYTTRAYAQDVPVDAPPIVEAPVTTDTDNQLIEALLKMFGINAPMSFAVAAVVAFLKTVLPTVPTSKISIGVCVVGAVLYYFARRAGLETQLQSILDWLINLALPALVMLFGGSTVHEVSAKMNVPVLGYKRGSPQTVLRG